MVEVIILYEKSAYDSQWPSQRESLETLHLQATILWEKGDFSNAIQRYRDLLQACETHLGHFERFKQPRPCRSSGMFKIDRNDICVICKWRLVLWSQDRPPYRKEGYISSTGETTDLQRFLLRYSDPTVAVLPLHEAASNGHRTGRGAAGC